MKIDSIECFLSLAETLNYTEAAEQQNMTQSALSKIVQQMEDELGFALLVRSRREVKLTPAGESFAEESRKTLDRYYSSVSTARNASAGNSGNVQMGIRIDMIEPLAFDIVRSFYKAYPGIHMDIRSMKNYDLVRSLDKGTLECAISTGTSRNPAVRSVVLDKYRECLVVNSDHPFAGRKSISLEEAKNERFVIIARHFSIRGNESLISKCRQAHFSPNIVAESASVPHLFANLASGPYVTLLSANFRDFVDDRFVFIPIEEISYTYLKFHWNTESNNQSVKVLADYIAEEFADYQE